MKQHTAARSSLEVLESRIAPATLVDFTLGKLTVTGDALSNFIDIYSTGPGTFRISGDSNASFQVGSAPAAPAVDFTGAIKAIEIHGNDGADSVSISDLKFGSLNFGGGANSDALTLRSINVKGDVIIDMQGVDPVDPNSPGSSQFIDLEGEAIVIGGKLSVKATGTALDTHQGSGLQLLGTAYSMTIGGSFSFTGTPNDDEASLGGDLASVYASLLKIGKEASATDTEAFNLVAHTVTVGKNTLGQSVAVTGGAQSMFGGDRFKLQGTQTLTTTGSVEFAGAGGGDTISLAGGAIRLGKNVAGKCIDLAQSVDGSHLSGSVTSTTSLTLAGYVSLTDAGVGTGINFGLTASGNALAIGKSSTGRSIDFHGGSGIDALNVNGCTSATLAGAIVYDGPSSTSITLNAGGGSASSASARPPPGSPLSPPPAA